MHNPARRLFLAVSLAVGIWSTDAIAAEPPNLSALKHDVKTYLESGEYQARIAQVAQEATDWLKQRAGSVDVPRTGRLAVVFDIDETLLSNLPHMRAMDFGYVPRLWDEWVDAGAAPGLEPVCELMRTVRRLGVAVFVLTGRSESDRAGTEKNLRAVGVGDYTGLRFKPTEAPQTTEAFKTAERKKITAEGYTIILNIGDQESDLAGGFAERTFKLPNPFYITK